MKAHWKNLNNVKCRIEQLNNGKLAVTAYLKDYIAQFNASNEDEICVKLALI